MKYYLSLTEPQNKLVAEIADVIKHYYPIGIRADSEDYRKHPGFIEIKAKLDEGFINQEVWEPWNLFFTDLKEGCKNQLRSVGSHMDMSYCGELILEKYEDEFLIRRKKIRFDVSRLAPFYTIYGVDETIIKDKDKKTGRGKYYQAINVITASPYQECEEGFNYLKTKIEAQFADYKFIPFFYCGFFIKDVQLPFTSWHDTTVYNAIFSGSLNMFHLPSIHLRGDQFYGILRW